MRRPSRSLQVVSVVYEPRHSHILLNVIRFPSRPLQEVSVIYESQHFHILLNVIRFPSRPLQRVSVSCESQHSHILLNVIRSRSRSLQRVSAVYESSHCLIFYLLDFYSEWVSFTSYCTILIINGFLCCSFLVCQFTLQHSTSLICYNLDVCM